ncbi:MAG TPA: biopolymer transporter ExbD [Candidatus Acidoferrales bacterium]|nr:biopolymer transporter ExbD [Candidatus Acidoferrales bacterium]
MGFSVSGGFRGVAADVNVVPLIDILLVLLVIFMIIPHRQTGLDARIPQPAVGRPVQPAAVVVQVLADGTLRINQDPVALDALAQRLGEIYRFRADHTIFVRGDSAIEFGRIAGVIDAVTDAGLAPAGLLTPDLESRR